ncbi:hypothetical protein MBLNU459_g2652t1 [Dothideomycetes sp. NU459]
MSTIASPRPSITLSRRTSASTDTTTRSPSVSRAPALPNTTQRRNRAALRDYYGLKNAAATGSSTPTSEAALEDPIDDSALDKADFNAEHYIRDVLAKEGLEGVLRVEAGLVSEIRGFDGERKALVYDNYSKLIAATDTIRKMRTNMDPLTPATSTLTPAISHIAETASTLSTALQKLAPPKKSEADENKDKQRQTVRWVLDSPARLRRMLDNGQQDAARSDWTEVSELLGKWQGVAGADEVMKECREVMKSEQNDEKEK